jgi:hypothetical protein
MMPKWLVPEADGNFSRTSLTTVDKWTHDEDFNNMLSTTFLWFSGFCGEGLNVIFDQNMSNLHNPYKLSEKKIRRKKSQKIQSDTPASNNILYWDWSGLIYTTDQSSMSLSFKTEYYLTYDWAVKDEWKVTWHDGWPQTGCCYRC